MSSQKTSILLKYILIFRSVWIEPGSERVHARHQLCADVAAADDVTTPDALTTLLPSSGLRAALRVLQRHLLCCRRH